MAGTPFRRALYIRIRDAGGWKRVFERVAGGETLQEIADSLACSRSFLNHLLRDDKKRRPIYEIARKESAGALVEKGLGIAMTVNPTRDEVAKAKMQVDQLRWMAERYDREQFGESKTPVSVVMNIGQLHLDALRARAVAPPPPIVPQLPAPIDAELLEEIPDVPS